MTAKNPPPPPSGLPEEGRPYTDAQEAEEIDATARRLRQQSFPGNGPRPPEKDSPVEHYKGARETVHPGANTDYTACGSLAVDGPERTSGPSKSQRPSKEVSDSDPSE